MGGERKERKRTVKNNLLRYGKLCVARSRWHVQHQHVDLAPVHLVQELLDGLHDHWAAPYDGTLLGDEVSHRHGLDAIVRHGDELVFLFLSVRQRTKGVVAMRGGKMVEGTGVLSLSDSRGSPERLNIVGMDGPKISVSNIPVLRPILAKESERLAMRAFVSNILPQYTERHCTLHSWIGHRSDLVI